MHIRPCHRRCVMLANVSIVKKTPLNYVCEKSVFVLYKDDRHFDDNLDIKISFSAQFSATWLTYGLNGANT